LDELFEALGDLLFDEVAIAVDGLGLLAQFCFLGFLIAVYQGSGLTPGTNPESGRQVEALVASYQRDAVEENSWPQFKAICDRVQEVSQRFYDSELELINAKRAAEGKEPLDRTSADLCDGSEVTSPTCHVELREMSRRKLSAFRAAGILELQAGLAARHKFIRPIPDGPLWAGARPEIGTTRAMVRVGTARIFVARENGDEAEWIAAIRDTLGAARPMSRGEVLIERLVYAAALNMIFGEVRQGLLETTPSPAAIRSVMSLVDDAVSIPPVQLTLDGERLAVLDFITRTYTDDGNENGTMIQGELERLTESEPMLLMLEGRSMKHKLGVMKILWTWGPPRKQRSIERCDEYFRVGAEWLAAAPRDRANRSPSPAELMNRFEDQHEIALGIMIPNLDKLATVLDVNKVEIDGTRLMLTLELFKAQIGNYPAALSELVPDFIAGLPLDPFTQRPYIYRRLQPGDDPLPNQQRPYLLYSTGFDALDDHARSDAEENFRPAKPDCKSGYDIVINRPR